MRIPNFHKYFKGILVITVIVLIALYSPFTFFSPHQPPQQTASVSYQPIKIATIRPWSQFSGKCRAIDYVEIRPRVSGVIQNVLFKEGAIVQKDDPLFIIDPRPFEAAVSKAKANLESVLSQEKLAGIELIRAEKLVKTNAVAKKEFDERKSTKEVRQADIEAAKASLKTAELDVEFAHIKSPIDGKISRTEITAGNLVEAGPNAPVLTTVVSTSSIYVDFDMDEQSYIDAAKDLDTSTSNADAIPVEVTLDGHEKTIYKGHIQSFDNKINPSTGTIKVRALVENPNDILVSGIFANVKVGTRADQKAILVPENAVGTDQNKKFVYVLNDQNQAVHREIKLGRSFQENRIVREGLKEGDKIIVTGIQHLRPGMTVKATVAKDKASPKENAPENDNQSETVKNNGEENAKEESKNNTREDAAQEKSKGPSKNTKKSGSPS